MQNGVYMKRFRISKSHINNNLTKKTPAYCLYLHQILLPLQRNNEEVYISIRPDSLTDCL